METIAARLPSPPAKALPEGAADCHAHVFGPLDRFPTGPSTYAIPLADPAVYEGMLASAGFTRGVLIQPAPYGQDTQALENALAQFGGRVKGIAVADDSISDERLYALDRAGVRGLRFIEMLDPKSGRRYAGSVGIDALKALAPRMKPLGWHAQIWAKCADIPRIFHAIEPFGLPVVFDHMGQYDAAGGASGKIFAAFLDVMRSERAYTKLSLCRLSQKTPGYEDLRAFHDALVETAPDRLLWGSDWPFVRMGANSPDVTHLVDIFAKWVKDEGLIHRILVDNPKRLFDFSAVDKISGL